MELLALGISHKTAALELRERLALPEGRSVSVMRELAATEPILEAIAISTCNRTELYMAATDPVEAESAALSVLAREADIRPTELVANLYSLRGRDASRHLFAVTSGLDAMIVGEAEIQGQVKRAYELALVEGVSGPLLNRLFRGALATGKRVRDETRVAERGVSVPSVAVELARHALGDLTDRRVLIVGAGETAELTARSLGARGVRAVFVANRRYDRAIGLAERFGGHAVRFDELPGELEIADIVVSSTASPHHIVERTELELVMERREGRPLLIIDLAVPRDIDPACREVPAVTLRDIDDLQALVQRNNESRLAEVAAAGRILDAELERFERWLSALDAVPTIAALRSRAGEIVEQVLAENESRWESLSDSDRERLRVMANAVVNRLLHEPTLRLREAGEDAEAYAHVQAARELFGLDPETAVPGDEGAVIPLRRRDSTEG